MSRGKPSDVIEVFDFNELTNRPSKRTCARSQAAQLVWSGLAKWVHRHKIVLEKRANGLSAVRIGELSNSPKTAKACPFPSLALREYYSQLRAEILAIEASEGLSSQKSTARVRICMQINNLRSDHEDLNGCRCWYTPAEIELNWPQGVR
jgi:hypothetical protein